MAMPWQLLPGNQELEIFDECLSRVSAGRSSRTTGTAAACRAGRRRGSLLGSTPVRTRVAVGIPAAAFELERTHRYQFLDGSITFRTDSQWRICYFLLNFKNFTAIRTFILVYWHFLSLCYCSADRRSGNHIRLETIRPKHCLRPSVFKIATNLILLHTPVNRQLRMIYENPQLVFSRQDRFKSSIPVMLPQPSPANSERGEMKCYVWSGDP
jgi:hypothetical protein